MIYEWMRMLYEGHPVAWGLFGSVIGFIVVAVLLVFLWWKMPQPAKRLLLNNLVGRHPIILNSYDDQHTRLQTPGIFGEGLFYDKKQGFHFSPRLTSDAKDKLSKTEREIVTKAFRLDGTNSAVYHAYSGKGTIVNAEIQALIQREKAFSKTKKVLVPKKLVIETLQKMDDKMVMLNPVYLTQYLDPRKIKEYIPKAFTKSALRSMEHHIREDERGKQGIGMNAPIGIMIIIVVVLQVIGLLKLFGMF